MPQAIHATHSDIIKRLRRAEGHLRNVIHMMEQERSCLELAQQLQAVEGAIAAAKKVLIHDHLDHCLDRAVGALSREARAPVDEFKEIAKYL